MRVCTTCQYPKIPEGKNRCPSCGTWQWSSALVSTLEEADSSILFEDITSADVDRIKTGILDHCLGGGMVRSDVLLLGGGPGGGKSTLVLQTAQIFCQFGNCIYIASEEDVRAIKARGDRMGIKPGRKLRFVPAMSGVPDIGELLRKHRPSFMIVDSLDELSGRDPEAELTILKALKMYAVELQAPAFVTSQVNKEEDYSGLKAKQHAVDVLLTLTADPNGRSENGEAIRVLETIKNRSGPAFQESYFEMTVGGLVPTLGPQEEGEESEDDDE